MNLLTVGILLTATGLAVYYDLTARRIPNWISAFVIAYGMTAHVWSGGWTGLFLSLGGLAIGGGVLLIPYLMGGMGTGDVKLLAAIGSVVGPDGIIIVFILTALAGGLLAIFVLLAQRRLVNTSNRVVRLFIDQRLREGVVGGKPTKRSVAIPYGVAISVGTWGFIGLWAHR